MRRSAFILLLALGTSCALAGRARAQSLAGPFKFDMKIGPALGIADEGGSQFHVGFHFGVDLTPHLQHHVYLDLPMAFNFGNFHTDIMILPGVEADIALPVGQPIYIYPMFGMGLAFLVPSCPAFARCDSQSEFGIRLGVGIKYILDGRWNFSFEPMNIEIYPAGSGNFTPGHYNLLFGAGVVF